MPRGAFALISLDTFCLYAYAAQYRLHLAHALRKDGTTAQLSPYLSRALHTLLPPRLCAPFHHTMRTTFSPSYRLTLPLFTPPPLSPTSFPSFAGHVCLAGLMLYGIAGTGLRDPRARALPPP